MRKCKLICSTTLLLLSGMAAHADIIGVPVEGIGSSTTVGDVNGDGTIDFYVPLRGSTSGTYGDGAGMSEDSCWYPYSCTGGTLDMYLRFEPNDLGPGLLSLDFNDLDLFGLNDPWYFLESIQILDSASNVLAFVDSWNDPEVVTANSEDQLLQMAIDVDDDPFFIGLHFTSTFSSNTSYGKYYNTRETLLASIQTRSVPVPAPATLSLLGVGLLAIGIASRRRRITA